MKHPLLIVFILISFYSCNQTDSTDSKNTNIVYQRKNIDCDWQDKVVTDTTFADNITFNIKTKCRENINFIDTVENGKDSFLIRNWRDVELIVHSNQFEGPLIINKESMSDSLASDLKLNGFLVPPHQIDYDKQDSSVILKSFIGHVDSDVGDIYVIKITFDKRVKVIRVEYPEMGIN